MKSTRRVNCARGPQGPGKPPLLARLSDLASAIRRKKPRLLTNKTNVPSLRVHRARRTKKQSF
jgi:hypothetical protein